MTGPSFLSKGKMKKKLNEFKQMYRSARVCPEACRLQQTVKNRKAGTCDTSKRIISKSSLFILPFKKPK